MNNKCEKKAPKKVHKSEREKRKRDKQNDLFGELGNMLGTYLLQIESAIVILGCTSLECLFLNLKKSRCIFCGVSLCSSYHLLQINVVYKSA